MLLLDVGLTVTPTVTPNQSGSIGGTVANNNEMLKEIISGLFNENMHNTVSAAPQSNFTMYVFLIVAVVLIIAVVLIMKMSFNSMTKGITTSITPFVSQLQALDESFKTTQRSYETMANRFTTLTERIVEVQATREAENDRIDSLRTSFTELQDNNYQYWTQTQTCMTDCKNQIIHMKNSCSLGWLKKFGYKLVDRGTITREEVDRLIQEIINEV